MHDLLLVADDEEARIWNPCPAKPPGTSFGVDIMGFPMWAVTLPAPLEGVHYPQTAAPTEIWLLQPLYIGTI